MKPRRFDAMSNFRLRLNDSALGLTCSVVQKATSREVILCILGDTSDPLLEQLHCPIKLI